MTTLRRVVAVLVSLLAPGAGHFLLGRWRRGAVWSLALVALVFLVPELRFIAMLGIVLVWLAAQGDVVFVAPGNVPRWGFGIVVCAAMAVLMDEAATAGKLRGETHTIPHSAMFPTLQPGDYIYAEKDSDDISRGDVIVFDYPLDREKKYVKRVLAIGGDKVSIDGTRILLNGTSLERIALEDPCEWPDAEMATRKKCLLFEEKIGERAYRVSYSAEELDRGSRNEWSLHAGQIFVLGDNRDNSADSRHWGMVPQSYVTGRVSFVWFAMDDDGIKWERFGDEVR